MHTLHADNFTRSRRTARSPIARSLPTVYTHLLVRVKPSFPKYSRFQIKVLETPEIKFPPL